MGRMACCDGALDGHACTQECKDRPLELLKEIVEAWRLTHYDPGISHALDKAIDAADTYLVNRVVLES